MERHTFFKVLIPLTLLLLIIGAGIYNGISTNKPQFSNSFSMNNKLTIKIDGKTVYYNPHDVISFQFYQYNFCKMFNDSNSCQQAGVGGIGLVAYGTNANANGCHTYNTAGVVDKPNQFTTSTRCSATAIFISNDTTAVTNSLTAAQLPTYYLGAGLAPVKGVSSYVALQNQITLTGTWTTTKSVTGIDKVAIGLWNDKNNAFVDTSNPSTRPLVVLTCDLFTPQTISSGQSFQVIFTISM